jgi:phosphinothricin acetyltransferase
MIRQATEQDANALARIYNQAMQPGLYATAFVKPVTRQDRIQWLGRMRYPFGAWVYTSRAGDVLAWCSLGPFAPRPYYPGIAEVSAYVEETRRSGIIGGKLLACLVTEGRRRGLRSLVSIAFEKNVMSISGCLEAGFRPMATLYAVATFGNVYENVSWIQKDLSCPDPPVLRRLIASFQVEEQSGIPSA